MHITSPEESSPRHFRIVLRHLSPLCGKLTPSRCAWALASAVAAIVPVVFRGRDGGSHSF